MILKRILAPFFFVEKNKIKFGIKLKKFTTMIPLDLNKKK